jgi:hypothetical protein
MIDPRKLEICKENFYYFNYFLKAKEDYLQHISISEFPLHLFFDDENMQLIFTLYNTFENEKIILIEEQEKRMGFSTFCCYLSYYMCFSSISYIVYVTDSKLIRETVQRIIEFAKCFKPITELDVTYTDIRKTLEFSNGSRMLLQSDITYDFRNSKKVADLLIFDNATMKNFDKLTTTIELMISNAVAKKAIINFNCVPPLFYGTENFEILIKAFKNYLTIVKVNK